MAPEQDGIVLKSSWYANVSDDRGGHKMNYWSDIRRGKANTDRKSDHRSQFEHDFDRLLFSTPVRRLSDKTQVWPLDRNDGVRTRLTHSHEVANLAKSIGKRLLKEHVNFNADGNDVVLPILSAIGLAHDLGNPPFGHQGEAAIGRWFKKNSDWIFTHVQRYSKPEEAAALTEEVPEKFYPEFFEFEGNAQTIRLVSKLQASPGNCGLDLTAGTLSALMKYTTPCYERKKKEDIGFNCSLKSMVIFNLNQKWLLGCANQRIFPMGSVIRSPGLWNRQMISHIRCWILKTG